jgi:hypothetical protein
MHPPASLKLVEELARLVSEKKRITERIRETQAVLTRVKKNTSESLSHRCMTGADHAALIVEGELMKTERSYERLLLALADMKDALAQQILELDKQIVRTHVEELRETFDQKRNLLNECLSGIDRKILDCLVCVEEHQRIHSDLAALSGKLHLLGSDSVSVPNPLPARGISEVVSSRIAHLRSQGKC